MAGIGFELRKLYREQGMLRHLKAYAYSSMSTVGPMALTMGMVAGIQYVMSVSDAAYLERELFLSTIVYAFIFSVLFTGGLTMLLTRFLADMLFRKKYEYVLSSYYGAAAVCLPASALAALVFLGGVQAGPFYKLAAFLLFMELILIWIQSVYLSALKDYKRIFRSFLLSAFAALAGAWAVGRFSASPSTASMLAAVDVGFFIVLLLNNRHFEHVFPARNKQLYFSFLAYFRKYPSLFAIGTLLYAGVYIHSFVYWLGSHQTRIAGRFAISAFYDTPVFYAYLSVVPALIVFTVAVETNFYEKFRTYYDLIRQQGTWEEISAARRDMQRSLVKELTFLMEIQLIFTILFLAAGIKFLPLIGFSMEQLDVYVILLLGYYMFIITFVILLLLLYYDDRKGVLMISGTFLLLNLLLGILTMRTGYDGYGMLLASFVALVLALRRTRAYVQDIDYYTFCAQPLTPPAARRSRPLWARTSALASGLIASVFLLAACSGEPADSASPAASEQTAAADSSSDSSANALQEDKRIYERDEDTQLNTLYLTVLPQKEDSNQAPLDWYQLNRIRDRMEEGELNVIFQEGAPDGSGPASENFGYSASKANGKVTLRGNSTRYAAQRSYKIKLNDEAGLWNDQSVINLSKHSDDATRLRNKLSFDLFETIPNMTSLRTRFVHLYVKDLSDGAASSAAKYEDYGLFTQVEQPNKAFLKNHWLDPYGELYKAIMFEFLRYPDELKPKDDPAYDKAKFESLLEIRGREDHTKLIAMLDDVNNKSIPIDEVMEKHFDLDNYLTWMASNILMDNMDTNTQNFLLYSPLNSEKWYFLPWDYDGAWERPRGDDKTGTYNNGISNYWGAELHNRFFRSEKNVKLLEDKIHELHDGYINSDTVSKLIAKYTPITERFAAQKPDINFFPMQVKYIPRAVQDIIDVPDRSIERFEEDVQTPKPYFLDDIRQKGSDVSFSWGTSFDLQGDDLTYTFTLARDLLFTDIVKQTDLADTHLDVTGLSSGTYYWKVTVSDTEQHTQVAFDIYKDAESVWHHGVREIEVE
ncbi:exopolysaccharide Pel transporter PelG [Saccharibacillus sp. CPCC 101409]|uniref:exopolysaccharide Pel transporter PelG n=1 Tax=Saccharibacillus sp. CPCC 101409 TaxID=3058041 RepID=UPI0026714A9F|nr:exopolysaccharide Pel transporter PelG [Saccharibacillus sp. CPCC 101409]MDO3411579.1 exopolysaccharide Pel transporter PelG [Saccharibacillus sp. CPCC 101409]